jgi:hypothetical protein
MHWKNHAPPNATHFRLPYQELSAPEHLKGGSSYVACVKTVIVDRSPLASSRDIALTENVAPQIQGRAARPKAVVYVLKILPAPGASPNIVAPPTTAATSNHHVTTPIEKCTVRESFHSGSNVSSKLLPEQLQSCSCRFQHRQLRTGRCLHTHVHKWSTDGSLNFAQPRGDSPPFYGYIRTIHIFSLHFFGTVVLRSTRCIIFKRYVTYSVFSVLNWLDWH